MDPLSPIGIPMKLSDLPADPRISGLIELKLPKGETWDSLDLSKTDLWEIIDGTNKNDVDAFKLGSTIKFTIEVEVRGKPSLFHYYISPREFRKIHKNPEKLKEIKDEIGRSLNYAIALKASELKLNGDKIDYTRETRHHTAKKITGRIANDKLQSVATKLSPKNENKGVYREGKKYESQQAALDNKDLLEARRRSLGMRAEENDSRTNSNVELHRPTTPIIKEESVDKFNPSSPNLTPRTKFKSSSSSKSVQSSSFSDSENTVRTKRTPRERYDSSSSSDNRKSSKARTKDPSISDLLTSRDAFDKMFTKSAAKSRRSTRSDRNSRPDSVSSSPRIPKRRPRAKFSDSDKIPSRSRPRRVSRNISISGSSHRSKTSSSLRSSSESSDSDMDIRDLEVVRVERHNQNISKKSDSSSASIRRKKPETQ